MTCCTPTPDRAPFFRALRHPRQLWIQLWIMLAGASALTAQQYDLLIRNGRVVDGTGAPWYVGDIAVRDGRIAAMGRLRAAPAKRVIDAAGMVVAPGFFDMMGQTAGPFREDPAKPLPLHPQGIT